jgi:trans-aconitate methyltransferase
MHRDHNPQAVQMGDESMARNLAFQAQAIWPQEQALFDRYALSGSLRILDLGCGTGEITRRLAQRYPEANVVGVDILDECSCAFRSRRMPPHVAGGAGVSARAR